ncbi:hypothetical protein PM076_07455 [Halorubrum ezzemoulense]|uniref:Restriction endonuclease n=1 Tax=Halorubrum ezzemoulense TaxID=337243 RepID=A0ABT4YZ85_HALEZ|nr:hypothetical protein [Halorubrum ezzemoulense]MDB2243311.1 hypothetical protein [Halorubrum ezzemoulense]MDB2277046.1 hypothetical protein [Halorubrum ezzemoulense]MDB2288673.1 hypothetical protein [Halorubrum ezzemoulense]MDB2291226.1 hypothetical protein [Halorubrum ezzemoulense]MDB2296144.1 hypothetical protein [Halorubrum ezzemoulense]
MVRDDDFRIGHDEIRDELKKQLVESGIPESKVSTEFNMDPPRWVRTRQVDVVWEFGDKMEANGIGFEIKRTSKGYCRMSGLSQLHSVALSGYYPVLVAQEEIYRDETGDHSSFERLVFEISASYVSMSENEGDNYTMNFEVIRNKLPSWVDVPDCFN